MRPLHAGTLEERMTGEKQEAAQHTRKKQIAGKAPQRASPWPATPHQPSQTLTSSRCRQSAGERIRSSTQQTHTLPAVICQWTRRSDTPPSPPVQSHGQRDTATARSQHTTHSERAISQRATRGSDSASIHDVATKFPAIPSLIEFGARLKSVIGGASRRRKSDSPCSHSLLPSLHAHRRRRQPPARNKKVAFKSTVMCILCVCVCLPAAAQVKKVKKRSRGFKETHKKNCTAKVHGKNNKTAQTHNRTADQTAAIHKKLNKNN
ncbi:hypothetical protein TCDM_10264 [Trypanosoma cruzi Dm28c]|uniref:Uncharacterized protein n=1 Tax=Trypanosoma cruzi Dm28c TaxID=1416333 RepID=V5BCJ2_TRYCR|nr:hypothetical protein TCDM_10264 [Trypanosoma cruzi Dm28c]